MRTSIWSAVLLTAWVAAAQDHAGSDTCGTCHDNVGEYMESKMARTTAEGAACQSCHSSRMGAIEESGVACERCHGPAAKHVSASGAAPLNRKPACAQCHQPGQQGSHAALLALAKCKLAGGGALTCTTCHDPHRTIAASERPAYYRGKCRTCHPQTHSSEQGRDQCTACHMPANPSAARHLARTDHSIRRQR